MLAKSFGIRGRALDGPGQIADALSDAFAESGPALLAVPVDDENRKLTERLGTIVCPI